MILKIPRYGSFSQLRISNTSSNLGVTRTLTGEQTVSLDWKLIAITSNYVIENRG